MEPLSLSLAVIGVTQFVKLAASQLFNLEVKQSYTIIVAVVAAGLLTFIDLEAEIIQNIYQGIIAVGGLTAGVKLIGAYKK